MMRPEQRIMRVTLDDNKPWTVWDGWHVISLVACPSDNGRSAYIVLEKFRTDPDEGRL